MLSLLNKWLSFVRFSHTLFALPFALAAMAVAAREDRGERERQGEERVREAHEAGPLLK
jgi:hypothetical protein